MTRLYAWIAATAALLSVGLLLCGCVGDNFELNPTAKDAPMNYGTNAPRR